jgi:hypothetical protein
VVFDVLDALDVRRAPYVSGVLRRLRRLTEAECYVRLYGRDEDTVRIVKVAHRRTGWGPRLSGAVLQSLSQDRLDGREEEAA